jgi:hypothetical protein
VCGHAVYGIGATKLICVATAAPLPSAVGGDSAGGNGSGGGGGVGGADGGDGSADARRGGGGGGGFGLAAFGSIVTVLTLTP